MFYLQVLLKDVIVPEKFRGRNSKKEDNSSDAVQEEEKALVKINEKDLQATKLLLQSFQLRRYLENPNLKGKKTCMVYVNQSSTQANIYKTLSDMSPKKPYLKQKRLCDLHPFLYAEDESPPTTEAAFIQKAISSSNKIKFICTALQILMSDRQKKHKVLIFSMSLDVLFILGMVINNQLKKEKMGYTVEMITGLSNDIEGRKLVIDRFRRDDNFRILLLSTKAMSEGVQMQAADTIIFHDQSYNPQIENQAEGRAYRTGQTEPVLVLRLVVVNSSLEQKTMEGLIKTKRKIQSSLQYDTETLQQSEKYKTVHLASAASGKGTIMDARLTTLLLKRENYEKLPKIKMKDDIQMNWP